MTAHRAPTFRKSSHSQVNETACVEVAWRTSSFTHITDCVEVGSTPAVTLLRDTKNRAGGLLSVPAPAFAALLDRVR